jgi:GT2 family glycosyltransferase
MQAASNAASSELGISVVVIGRNEGKRLERCLESIARAPGNLIREVIYVDSRSTDGSVELACRGGATAITLNPGRTTAAMGRNAGWTRATSDLILFLDGDTILDPDFPVVACKALAQDAQISVVWGHRREINPQASVFNRVLDLDWIYPPGITEFCGGDAMMRRKALVEVEGFDDSLIAGEEPDLCRRMRALHYKILHIDHPMTGHDLQITRWNQYWKRASRAGHAYAEISARFRKSGDPFWSADRRRNLLRGSFWLISFVAATVTTVRFGVMPLVVWLSLFCVMALRSAWKARWKCGNLGTLLLYGFHSHFQQIPVLFGQLQYELTKGRSGARQIIEYKESGAE